MSAPHPFELRLMDIRARLKPEPYEWYRWDTLTNLDNLNALLPRGLESLVALAGEEPLADIGTGDGDLAFLLESLGCRVTAMDWPGTNMNQMEGARLLKRELGSGIEIREVDLDGHFRFDGERFGLALSLGLLYHLKNPFYFLETLGRHARHCVLSTAILPREKSTQAVAYLASDGEFENDTTNYWFFSEPGLLRLLDRCGWDVVRQFVAGPKGDRFFCHAESRIAKSRPVIRLLDGWHQPEGHAAWRWTKKEFAAVIENTARATRFELRFRKVYGNPLTVQAEVNGEALAPQSFQEPGDYVYTCPVTRAARMNTIRVRLSETMQPDGRELGVVVALPASTILDEESGLRLL